MSFSVVRSVEKIGSKLVGSVGNAIEIWDEPSFLQSSVFPEQKRRDKRHRKRDTVFLDECLQKASTICLKI